MVYTHTHTHTHTFIYIYIYISGHKWNIGYVSEYWISGLAITPALGNTMTKMHTIPKKPLW